MMKQRSKVVVMGGGTGIFPVISALKQLDVEICSIVAVSDSGGSTGRIRDEFGFQPVGDLRQSLAALAGDQAENWIQKLLLYRFSKGTGLVGHNLGNLLLTALQDMTGDTTKAMEIAEKIFRLDGTVIPVTSENVQLKIYYEDGTHVIGEHILDGDSQDFIKTGKKVSHVELEPNAQLNPLADHALREADLIIIGPGDYYASLMAVLVPEGVKAAMANSNAKVAYILNLMTRISQTRDMTAQDHISGIEKIIGRELDVVIINNQPIPQEVLDVYATEKEFPVVDDVVDNSRIIRAPIINEVAVEKKAYDTAHRSLLRHSDQKLLAVIQDLLL